MAKLLVVDDEVEIAKLVSKIMESQGHSVSMVHDGEAAVQAALAQLPDVIVLDLNIPKLDGFEVCKRLKTDARTKNIPIIMLTAAYPTMDDASRGLGVGADEYVVKPFLKEVLIHNVERLLASRAASSAE